MPNRVSIAPTAMRVRLLWKNAFILSSHSSLLAGCADVAEDCDACAVLLLPVLRLWLLRGVPLLPSAAVVAAGRSIMSGS